RPGQREQHEHRAADAEGVDRDPNRLPRQVGRVRAGRHQGAQQDEERERGRADHHSDAADSVESPHGPSSFVRLRSADAAEPRNRRSTYPTATLGRTPKVVSSPTAVATAGAASALSTNHRLAGGSSPPSHAIAPHSSPSTRNQGSLKK